MRHRSPTDAVIDLPSGEPTSRRERWRAAAYLTSTTVLITLVIFAVVFDRFAATGVLIVVFLSFVLAYLIGPSAERLRYAVAPSRRARPLSRGLAVMVIYGILAVGILPVWTFNRHRLGAAIERMAVLVPEHTARFIRQVHESERWHETLGLPIAVNEPLRGLTRRVIRSVEGEARALGGELAGIRRLVPWLSAVPVVAFVLLTRWRRFRRSTTRVLPTPHLQWRGNEWLRNLNDLLAAYTRAQATSAVIVGVICWIGFAGIGLSYPGTLGIAAGLLEMVPLAGPLVLAVVATATAPGQVVPVLVFLASLRVLQDYVVYPRLISRALHLHPVAVVVALWIGAGLGGVVGVCLAVPIVGMMRVTYRHWREYRDIDTLVTQHERSSAMAESRKHPYVQFNFLVNFGAGDNQGPDAGFQEISGLSTEGTVAASRENGESGAVTLKRGVISSPAFSAWLDDIHNGTQNAGRVVSVRLQSEDHSSVVQTWKLTGARITKHASGPLNAKGADLAIEELVLSCKGIEVE